MESYNSSYEKMKIIEHLAIGFDFDIVYDGLIEFLTRIRKTDNELFGVEFKYTSLKLTSHEIANVLFLARRRKDMKKAGVKMGGRKSRIRDILILLKLYLEDLHLTEKETIDKLVDSESGSHYARSTIYKALKQYKQLKQIEESSPI